MEIKIGKSARQCLGCRHRFVHDEELTSLVRVENQAFVREDYCPACWAPERGAGSYSVWSLRFYDPKVAEQEPPEAFSPLRQVFYESAEASSRLDVAVAYLAGQLLRRQKVFRHIKESEDPETGERVTLFSDRIGNRLIEVRDPSLTHEELESGRSRLVERLSELEAPEETEESVEEDAESEEIAASSG